MWALPMPQRPQFDPRELGVAAQTATETSWCDRQRYEAVAAGYAMTGGEQEICVMTIR